MASQSDLMSLLTGEFNGLEFVFDEKGNHRRKATYCANTLDLGGRIVRSLHIQHDLEDNSTVLNLLIFGAADGGAAYMHRFDSQGHFSVTAAIGRFDGESVRFEQDSAKGRVSFTYRFIPEGYEYEADVFPAGEPIQLVRGRFLRAERTAGVAEVSARAE